MAYTWVNRRFSRLAFLFSVAMFVVIGVVLAPADSKAAETKTILGEMPVTEAFNGGTTAVSDFATKWAPLQWTGSSHKGKDNANGYGPVDTASNGAYFIPPVSDQGSGLAAQATIAAGPGVGGRVSLWLDMTNPATEKSGYELSLVETGANVYTVAIKRYLGAGENVLASVTGYSLPAGSSVALVDAGPEVSAWAKTGSEWSAIKSAADTSFAGGNAAVEVQGSTATRVTNFKLGITSEKKANVDAALKAVPVVDDFERNESPLAAGWAALPWDTAPVKTGKTEVGFGWSPAALNPVISGAYWQKAMASDTGAGDAVVVAAHYFFTGGPYSFGLWLNSPSMGSTRNGYQLRVGGLTNPSYETKLIKWVNGTATTLASTNVTGIANGAEESKLALVDKGGTVSVWYCQNGCASFHQVLSAADTTYSYGYAGIEAVGVTLLDDTRLGQLPRY